MDNEDTGQRTPLTGLEGGGPLAMEERAGVGKVIFRGEPDEKVRDAFRAATGMALPLKSNTVHRGENGLVLWLGPDEWMVHCPSKEVAALCDRLEKEIEGIHAACVDVSDYYTVIRIGGPHALDALAHGCPLDLHPSAFGADDCAQSRFDSSAILLYRVDDGPTFDVQVRWSHAEHVWTLLGTVARELDELQ